MTHIVGRFAEDNFIVNNQKIQISIDKIMNSQLIRTEELLSVDVEEMFVLLNNHFQGVKKDVFHNDLNNKNWVILIKDEQTN